MKGTPTISALSRTLAMLEAVVADGGQSNISAIARSIGMPVATAHRQVATLVAEGYLRSGVGNRHFPGERLLNLVHRLDEKQLIANVAAPVLHRLATRLRCIVQMGTLENDMVTYRIKMGHGSHALFTRVGMQLEAYCSAIGKVLLANLPATERSNYLAGGPFVALTPYTITDPAALAAELERVHEQGHAFDEQEIALDLSCVAVPIHSGDGRVMAAISASAGQWASEEARLNALSGLKAAADEISKYLDECRQSSVD